MLLAFLALSSVSLLPTLVHLARWFRTDQILTVQADVVEASSDGVSLSHGRGRGHDVGLGLGLGLGRHVVYPHPYPCPSLARGHDLDHDHDHAHAHHVDCFQDPHPRPRLSADRQAVWTNWTVKISRTLEILDFYLFDEPYGRGSKTFEVISPCSSDPRGGLLYNR